MAGFMSINGLDKDSLAKHKITVAVFRVESFRIDEDLNSQNYELYRYLNLESLTICMAQSLMKQV